MFPCTFILFGYSFLCQVFRLTHQRAACMEPWSCWLSIFHKLYVQHHTPGKCFLETSQSAILQENRKHVEIEVGMMSGTTWKFTVEALSTTAKDIKMRVFELACIPFQEIILLDGENVMEETSAKCPAADCEAGQVFRIQMLRQRRRFLISGSEDCTLRVWLWDDATCTSVLKGHASSVNCVSVDWDAGQALSGSCDTTAKMWRLVDGKCLRTFCGHTAGVTCVALGCSVLRAVSGSSDSTLKLWDIEHGICLHTSRCRGELTCVAAHWVREQVVTGSSDGFLQVWSLESLTCVRCIPVSCRPLLRMLANAASVLSHAPDDSFQRSTMHLFAMADWAFAAHGDNSTCLDLDMGTHDCCIGDRDGSVRIWDLEADTARTIVGSNMWMRCRGALGEEMWHCAAPSPVSCVTANCKAHEALSGNEDGVLSMLDLKSCTVAAAFHGHESRITCIAADWLTQPSKLS